MLWLLLKEAADRCLCNINPFYSSRLGHHERLVNVELRAVEQPFMAERPSDSERRQAVAPAERSCYGRRRTYKVPRIYMYMYSEH